MKSIISNEKRCFVCGKTFPLHRHHVFFGTANRKKSEEYGCWVYLCAAHHNMSNAGVHCNATLDHELKRRAQEAWEMQYGSRADFILAFGRSYIDNDQYETSVSE